MENNLRVFMENCQVNCCSDENGHVHGDLDNLFICFLVCLFTLRRKMSDDTANQIVEWALKTEAWSLRCFQI